MKIIIKENTEYYKLTKSEQKILKGINFNKLDSDLQQAIIIFLEKRYGSIGRQTTKRNNRLFI